MKSKNILIGVGAVLAVDFAIAKINKTPKIIYLNKLPLNYNAQTIPPFGILIQSEDKNNTNLLKHELVHWEQYRKTGAIIFYLKYAFQKIFYGYDKMPIEIEAREKVGESEYCITNITDCVRNGQSITIFDPNFRA